MKFKSLKILALTMLIINSGVTWSASCEEYPYTDGITPLSEGGNKFKLLSTYSASVNFDDTSAIRDAREEATMQAKAAISAFLSETAKNENDVSRVVDESVTMQGAGKSAIRKEVTQRLMHLAQNSQALLRGVVPLGDCYTALKEVRVTVGIKSETIDLAGNVSGKVSQSISVQPTMTNAPQNNGGTSNNSAPLNGSTQSAPTSGNDGFSHTERLKNF
jgi:hypothetical protein